MTFGRQSRLLKPIFVVGCPRSGTTVIGRCLSAHPDVGGSDESMFLGSLARIYQNFYVGDNPRAAAPLKNYISEDDLLGTLGRCSDDIFGSLLARLGRPRYLDHTPWYSRSIDFIDRLYPDAVFIHVIRDGRDVVASLEHSYRSGYWWAGATQTDRSRLWVQLVSTCQQSATRLSLAPARRYIEVSYEQLCSTPFRQLGDLLDFLDLPLNAAVFEPLAEPHTVPRAQEERSLSSSPTVYVASAQRLSATSGQRIGAMMTMQSSSMKPATCYGLSVTTMDCEPASRSCFGRGSSCFQSSSIIRGETCLRPEAVISNMISSEVDFLCLTSSRFHSTCFSIPSHSRFTWLVTRCHLDDECLGSVAVGLVIDPHPFRGCLHSLVECL